MSEHKRLRVVRMLVMEGPEEWINETLKRCAVTPTMPFFIKGTLLGEADSSKDKAITETERLINEVQS